MLLNQKYKYKSFSLVEILVSIILVSIMISIVFSFLLTMKTNYNPVLLLQRYTLLEQYHEKYWIEYPIQDSIYLDSKYLIKTVIKQQKEDYLLLQTTQLLDSTGRQVLELKSYRVEFKNELQ